MNLYPDGTLLLVDPERSFSGWKAWNLESSSKTVVDVAPGDVLMIACIAKFTHTSTTCYEILLHGKIVHVSVEWLHKYCEIIN